MENYEKKRNTTFLSSTIMMITAMGKVGLVASSSSLTDKNNTTRQLGQKQQPLPSLLSKKEKNAKKTKLSWIIQPRNKFTVLLSWDVTSKTLFPWLFNSWSNRNLAYLCLLGLPAGQFWSENEGWPWKAAAVAVYNNTTCTNANFFSHSLLRKECLRPNLLDFETF